MRVTARGVELTLDGQGVDRARFLECLLACREGRCDCPSNEFGKLGSLSVRGEEPGVIVDLAPRAGARDAIDGGA